MRGNIELVETKSSPSRGGWVRPLGTQQLSVVRFARSREDALLAGVCGGLGARLGVEPVLVRIAFVVLSFAGAVGVVAYLVAWTISLDPGDRRAPPAREPNPTQSIAFGAIVLGIVLILREVGLWLGDPLGMPLLIASVGAGVIYVGAGRERRPQWTSRRREAPVGRPPLVNLVLGGLLVVGGVAWFLTSNRSFEGIFAVLLSVVVTAAGLAVVFGPWVYRLANQLGTERRDRIRSEERSELAAHLHDSVLQTLALIQRNAGSPRKMASLARRQERELRTWLYGPPSAGPGHLEAAVHEMADAIEEGHEISVEVVVVGDCRLDDRTAAVVHACREATTNAARHSGMDEVSVYIECEPSQVTAFVRDRGKGFDPNANSRGHGIPDSIRGRIERQGGAVNITSARGEGCEVQITMPVMPS
jgi:signal transduction histidine kinase/phage shock protein PspC (stress-responsive transcriptional regulator)